jgi:membrane-associated phospholipid phosphatase
MYQILKNMMYQIGKFGPVILLISSLYLLRNNNLFFYYLLGFLGNLLLNLFLKGMFKCPRPSENLKSFNLALKRNERFKFVNGIPHDIFGMPSGHAESVFYSTVFIYLALKDTTITIMYLLLSLLTMYQRVKFNAHTILQVIVGAIVGIIFGFFVYYVIPKIKSLKI